MVRKLVGPHQYAWVWYIVEVLESRVSVLSKSVDSGITKIVIAHPITSQKLVGCNILKSRETDLKSLRSLKSEVQ